MKPTHTIEIDCYSTYGTHKHINRRKLPVRMSAKRLTEYHANGTLGHYFDKHTGKHLAKGFCNRYVADLSTLTPIQEPKP